MLLEEIKNIEFYTGSKKDLHVVSVTEVCDNEPLLGYYRRMYEPMKSGVSQATLGNIFDIGMKTIIKERIKGNYSEGIRLNYTTPNGHKLTGEPDIINVQEKEIYDVKLTKVYKYLMVLKNQREDSYVKQLNFYALMLGWENPNLFLFMGLKDQNKAKPKDPDAIEELKVENIAFNELNEMIDDYYIKLQSLLSGSEKLPEKCENTFGNDMKCKDYCDYVHVCKYGKKYNTIASSWF